MGNTGFSTELDAHGSVIIKLELSLRLAKHENEDVDEFVSRVMAVASESDEKAGIKEHPAYRFTKEYNAGEQALFDRVHQELAASVEDNDYKIDEFAVAHRTEFAIIVSMVGCFAVRSTVFSAEDDATSAARADSRTTVWTKHVQPLTTVCKSFRCGYGLAEVMRMSEHSLKNEDNASVRMSSETARSRTTGAYSQGTDNGRHAGLRESLSRNVDAAPFAESRDTQTFEYCCAEGR